MSYLGDKIAHSICLEKNLRQLKDEIERDLGTLNKSNNHRVSSDKNGGCLLPASRKKNVRDGCLTCSGTKGEVVFGRAIFNSVDRLNGYKLLTYEAPFFRKENDKENNDISVRQVACDLIGIKGSEFCCVELKTNATNKDTRIPYALLEAYSYWVCANWIFENRKENLMQEIECAKRCHDVKNDKVIDKITFAVALTEEYVKGHSVEDSSLITMIETAIKKICPKAFSGYWVLSANSGRTMWEKTDEVTGRHVPRLTGPLKVVVRKSAKKLLA